MRYIRYCSLAFPGLLLLTSSLPKYRMKHGDWGKILESDVTDVR